MYGRMHNHGVYHGLPISSMETRDKRAAKADTSLNIETSRQACRLLEKMAGVKSEARRRYMSAVLHMETGSVSCQHGLWWTDEFSDTTSLHSHIV